MQKGKRIETATERCRGLHGQDNGCQKNRSAAVKKLEFFFGQRIFFYVKSFPF